MLALEQDSGFLGFNSKLEKGYELTFKPLLPHYTTQEEEAAAAEEVQVPVPAPATNANPPVEEDAEAGADPANDEQQPGLSGVRGRGRRGRGGGGGRGGSGGQEPWRQGYR